MKRLLSLCVLCAICAPVLAQDNRSAAEQALAAVDEIIVQVSKITGLKIKEPVKSAVVSREQIRGYIQERMRQTTTPERLRAQQVALQKFGLLPPGFQLEQFVVDLLAEQATAYYDPRRKQFYLSDWAPLELQKPAIAHELTHALQDQYIDLDQFLQKDGMNQDEQMARVAVVEGQGVLAMMEYMLGGRGEKTSDYPNLSEYVAQATMAETSKFPVFAAAPAYLRESLLFPYTVGLSYVKAMSGKLGKEGQDLYAALLDRPPRSTYEVLHPGSAPLPPAEPGTPPVPAEALAGFRKLDTNVLGELDLMVLLKQMLSQDEARAITPGWRGLKYDVFENDKGGVILAHRSVWKDAATARAFYDAYRRIVIKKGGEAETRSAIRDNIVDFVEGIRPTVQVN
jgi:hypothetical protein